MAAISGVEAVMAVLARWQPGDLAFIEQLDIPRPQKTPVRRSPSMPFFSAAITQADGRQRLALAAASPWFSQTR